MAVAGFAVTSSSSLVSQSEKGCGGGGGGGAWKHELVLLLNLQRLSYGSSRLCCYFIFKFSLTVPERMWRGGGGGHGNMSWSFS